MPVVECSVHGNRVLNIAVMGKKWTVAVVVKKWGDYECAAIPYALFITANRKAFEEQSKIALH